MARRKRKATKGQSKKVRSRKATQSKKVRRKNKVSLEDLRWKPDRTQKAVCVEAPVRTVTVQSDCFIPYQPTFNPAQAINDATQAWFMGVSTMLQTFGLFFGGRSNAKV